MKGFYFCMCNIRKSYLAKFVDPDKYYEVNYTIKQSGKRIYKKSKLKGSELTEDQILWLFMNEKL